MENENQNVQEPVAEPATEPVVEYATVESVEDANAQAEKNNKVLDIVALICGIVAIVLGCCGGLLNGCCSGIASLPAIAAVILPIVSRSKNPEKKFSGIGIAGLICGAVAIVGMAIIGILAIFGLGASALVSNLQ